jgi:VWFA-related protein
MDFESGGKRPRRPAGQLTLATAVGAVALVSTLAASGHQQRERPQFRGRTDVVRIDVSVLDADRRPVRGLTAADFTILENGSEYPVIALTEIDLPAPDVSDPAWTNEVPPDVETNTLEEGRLFVIVFDDALLPADAAYLIQQSKGAALSVIDKMGPTDLTAVVFTSDARRSQNFTRDRERLRAAVDRLAAGFFGAPQMDFAAEAGGTADMAFADEQLMRASLSTLKSVAETLIDGPERRKALVYIGRGIALDYSNVTTQIGPGASGFLEGAIFHDVLEYEMGKIFEHAQRANVAVYAIDPTGLDVEPDNRRRDYLETLAANTGGIAVTDSNEFEPGVARIYQENSTYYLLGYEPAEPPRPGAFRAVDVRVNRPGLTVRARNGYYGLATDEDEAAATSPVAEAAAGLLPTTDMPMRVHAAPFPMPGRDEGVLIITAELRQPAPAERVTQEVELIATAYDNEGRHAATLRQTAELVLRPTGGEARYEVLSQLHLEPGRYNIRFAGYNDELDLGGSVYADIEIPAVGDRELALSGVLLNVDPPLPSAPRDVLADLVPVLPTTRRDLVAYQRTTAFARIYQGRRRDLAPVRMTATILDAAGRVAFEQDSTIESAAFRQSRTADYELVLPLLDLAPGPHLLTLTAADASGDASVTRRVRFSIQ